MKSADRSYLAFENRFRGDSSIIKSRLQFYELFVSQVARHLPALPVVDLGCGRGEWLEVVSSFDLPCTGVDIDSGMIEACAAKGLRAVKSNIIDYLAALPANSHSIVSSFHVVEHLSSSEVAQIVDESHRVLAPGGILILETPNPENISVATNSFYLDPSHLRPIPPPYLQYLADTGGFARSAIYRLQEDPSIRMGTRLSLIDLFNAVSPDYALVAQKYTPDPIFLNLTPAFCLSTGVTLHDLASRYEAQQQQDIEQRFRSIEALQHNTELQLHALLASRSWRLTAPLRRFGAFKSKLKSSVASVRLKLQPHSFQTSLRSNIYASKCLILCRQSVLGLPYLYTLVRFVYRKISQSPSSLPPQARSSILIPWMSIRSGEILADLQRVLRSK